MVVFFSCYLFTKIKLRIFYFTTIILFICFFYRKNKKIVICCTFVIILNCFLKAVESKAYVTNII